MKTAALLIVIPGTPQLYKLVLINFSDRGLLDSLLRELNGDFFLATEENNFNLVVDEVVHLEKIQRHENIYKNYNDTLYMMSDKMPHYVSTSYGWLDENDYEVKFLDKDFRKNLDECLRQLDSIIDTKNVAMVFRKAYYEGYLKGLGNVHKN